MSKKEKLIDQFKSNSDFTWSELETLMKLLKFEQFEGKGSRVRFERKGLTIAIHKAHPDPLD